MKRVAIYVRISDDRAGQGLGVKRQREDCLELVAKEGWEIVLDGDSDVFSDNDQSAYSGKKRPAYLRLIDAIKAGEVDVVLAWNPDRLHRSMTELEEWIALLDATGTSVVTIRAGVWDLSSPSGRMIARQLGAVARYESENKSDRIRRTMIQNAEMGRAHGRLRTYGMSGSAKRNADGTHTWEEVVEEADILRECVARVISGETLFGITKDLNARGVKTHTGADWTRQSLRRTLMSPRIAGWREHTPGRQTSEKVRWSGGEFTSPAEWPAIVPRADVERVRRILGEASRQRGPVGRTYVLSGGLATCEECGANLRGRIERGSRKYSCPPPHIDGKGCGRVSIAAEPLEDAILDALRVRIDSGDFSRRTNAKDDSDAGAKAYAEDEEITRLIAELAVERASGEITKEEWQAMRAPLLKRQATSRSVLSRHQEHESASLLAGGLDRFNATWQEASTDKRRAMLRSAMTEIKVSRATKRGSKTFDATRVDPRWIDADAA